MSEELSIFEVLFLKKRIGYSRCPHCNRPFASSVYGVLICDECGGLIQYENDADVEDEDGS